MTPYKIVWLTGAVLALIIIGGVIIGNRVTTRSIFGTIYLGSGTIYDKEINVYLNPDPVTFHGDPDTPGYATAKTKYAIADVPPGMCNCLRHQPTILCILKC